MRTKAINLAYLLHEADLRATPGRIELIELLAKESLPLTIKEVKERLPSKLNDVTLYRALEALTEVGIVNRVDLQHSHTHYELAVMKKHHHHLVCTDCGTIEDFVNQACESLLANTVKKSDSFKLVTGHSMELFGLCRSCA